MRKVISMRELPEKNKPDSAEERFFPLKEVPFAREKKNIAVPIHKKYLLSIREAAAYFGLNVKLLRRLAEANVDRFAICNGIRYMIIRPSFERFLEEATSLSDGFSKDDGREGGESDA